MSEMIKALIADGWEWGTQDERCGYPVLHTDMPYCEGGRWSSSGDTIPFMNCLLPNITFENSPVELKTLIENEV